MKFKHTVDSWGISYDEFSANEWGDTRNGKFKVARSIMNQYVIDREITDDEGNTTITKEFDHISCFNAFAQNFINVIVSVHDFLKDIEFMYLLEEDQHILRRAVYEAIQFASTQREEYEKNFSSSIQMAGYTTPSKITGWMTKLDRLGQVALNTLDSARLHEYEIIPYENLYSFTKDKNGNVEVIAQIDISDDSDIIQ